MSGSQKLSRWPTVRTRRVPVSLAGLSHDDVGKLVLAQQRQIAELMTKVEALQAEVECLQGG